MVKLFNFEEVFNKYFYTKDEDKTVFYNNFTSKSDYTNGRLYVGVGRVYQNYTNGDVISFNGVNNFVLREFDGWTGVYNLEKRFNELKIFINGVEVGYNNTVVRDEENNFQGMEYTFNDYTDDSECMIYFPSMSQTVSNKTVVYKGFKIII